MPIPSKSRTTSAKKNSTTNGSVVNGKHNQKSPGDVLEHTLQELKSRLQPELLATLETWQEKLRMYQEQYFTYTVRGKEIRVENYTESLSHQQIPKIAVPKFHDWGDIVE